MVLLVSGQYFGWWNAPLPGIERVPSYEARKNQREAERSARRRESGLEDEEGNAIETDSVGRRRSQALSQGSQVGAN